MTFDPGAPASGDGIFGLPHTPEEARVVLVPVPWEPTTSYRRGTAGGPAAILRASRQVDLFDLEHGRPYHDGIAMLGPDPWVVQANAEACAAADPVIAAGGRVDGDLSGSLARSIDRVNALSRELDERVYAVAKAWLDRGKLVGIVGGDHSVSFGSIRAHAERSPRLGVLHVDAHADMRRAYEGFVGSHASILHNVSTHLGDVARVVHVGVRDLSEEEHESIAGSGGRHVAFFDPDVAQRVLGGEPFAAIAGDVVESLPRDVYVTFDIDGLDPALCPHTGTPVPGGLSFREACRLLSAVVESGRRIVGFDLTEVAPGPDGDEWDANVGARLLYKLIGAALRSTCTSATRTPGHL